MFGPKKSGNHARDTISVPNDTKCGRVTQIEAFIFVSYDTNSVAQYKIHVSCKNSFGITFRPQFEDKNVPINFSAGL
jgi:hypothetical protein